MEPKEPLVERIFSEPAELLEKGLEEAELFEEKLISKRPFKVAGKYWSSLGPGLVTGASDDDPSGIATYSQTGAQYGFQLLWLSWFTFPLMAVVQEMCARIGIVTGRGLAANIRHHYSPRVLYFVTLLLFAANAFNIGADLGAMAQGVQLIFPHASFAFLVIGFAVISLLLQIFTTYARYARYLKYLAFILLAYVFSALLSHLDWHSIIIHTIKPTLHFTKEEIFLVCAILGTTISPYLFFWQTSQEVEERTVRTHKEETGWHQHPSKETLKNVRSDVWTGMFFSNIVMFFIIAACAGTLYANGITNITSAADAAAALRPIAGNAAYFLFAIGIIGTGMLAIPVLAGSTSYALSESFGWKHGLYRKLNEAYAFYGVIIVSMILGILLNFIGLDPIHALIYSAVGNGIVAPVVLFFIVRLSSDQEVMREHVNRPLLSLIGWITIWLMVVAGVAVLYSLFS
jgi:NRAMP (natural resistance-associated macrophage protein)-like metal ion transporter